MLIIYLFFVKKERERERKKKHSLHSYKTYEDMISLSMSMAQSNPSVIRPLLLGIKGLFTWRWVQR